MASARQGSDGQKGNGRDVRPTSDQRRGKESMSNYYIRTGKSKLGATGRTRGTSAKIKPGRARNTMSR